MKKDGEIEIMENTITTEPFNIPVGTKRLEIMAKAPNGIFFPLLELDLTQPQFAEFQNVITLRYTGHIGQLKVSVPSG